MLNMTGTHHIN